MEASNLALNVLPGLRDKGLSQNKSFSRKFLLSCSRFQMQWLRISDLLVTSDSSFVSLKVSCNNVFVALAK